MPNSPIVLLLHLEPMGCPRPRATIRGRHAGTYMDRGYLAWQAAAVAAMADRLVGCDVAWLSSGCRAHIEAVFPRPKGPLSGWTAKEWRGGPRVRRLSSPDADNVWKAAIDALQITLRDRLMQPFDDRVVEGGAVDRWYAAATERPSLRVVLSPLMDNPMDSGGAE